LFLEGRRRRPPVVSGREAECRTRRIDPLQEPHIGVPSSPAFAPNAPPIRNGGNHARLTSKNQQRTGARTNARPRGQPWRSSMNKLSRRSVVRGSVAFAAAGSL